VENIEQNLRLPQCDEASSKLKQSKKNKRMEKQKACAPSIDDEKTWKEELLRKVRELEAAQRASDVQSKKISVENDALQKEVERLRHLEQLRSVPQVSDRGDRAVSNTSPSTLPQRRCFNCDDPGHFVRNCPISRRQTSEELQRGNEDLRSYQVNRASNSSYINFDFCLRMTTENKVYDCLLDTGSEVCILPEAMVDPWHIKETRHTLRAANGAAISTLGEATLPMSIGSFDSSVTGLVSDHVSEIMLGINWLVAKEAVRDFKSSIIWLNGHSFLLHPRPDKHMWCRCVVVQEEIKR